VYAIGSTTSAPAPASQYARSGARTSNGTVRVSPGSRMGRVRPSKHRDDEPLECDLWSGARWMITRDEKCVENHGIARRALTSFEQPSAVVFGQNSDSLDYGRFSIDVVDEASLRRQLLRDSG